MFELKASRDHLQNVQLLISWDPKEPTPFLNKTVRFVVYDKDGLEFATAATHIRSTMNNTCILVVEYRESVSIVATVDDIGARIEVAG